MRGFDPLFTQPRRRGILRSSPNTYSRKFVEDSSGIHRLRVACLYSRKLRKGATDMAVTNRLGAVLLASMLAAAAMVVVLVGPGAQPAKAKVQTPPPTLTGESLQADACRALVDPTSTCISYDQLPGEVTVTS